MNIIEIKALLNKNKEKILSYESKNDRIDYIIWLLEETYHDAPVNGSIEDFVTAANHIEIQPVLNVLREFKTRASETELIGNPLTEDIVNIVNFIQRMFVFL